MPSTSAGLWEDTALIVCTDHGHYLGETSATATTSGASPACPSTSRSATRRCSSTGPGRRRRRHLRRADHQRRPPRHHRRRLRGPGRAPHPRPVAGPAARRRRPHRSASGRSGGSAATGCRSPTADTSTPGPPRATSSRLSMWSNRWSTMPIHITGIEACRHPIRGRGSTRCPAARSRSSASRTRPATRCRSGPAPADGSATITSTTSTSIPTSRRTAVGESAVETEMIDLLRTALDDVDAPDEQAQRLGLA